MDLDQNVDAMWTEARGYLAGAERLARSSGEYGASGPVLATLAMEILLKAVYLKVAGSRSNHRHDYRKLWADIPEAVRNRIVAHAHHRFGPHADLTDLDTKLDALRQVFKGGRYSYEVNFGRATEEVRQAGDKWIASGAKPVDAEFAYYPETRAALIHGAQRVLEEELGRKMNDRPEIL